MTKKTTKAEKDLAFYKEYTPLYQNKSTSTATSSALFTLPTPRLTAKNGIQEWVLESEDYFSDQRIFTEQVSRVSWVWNFFIFLYGKKKYFFFFVSFWLTTSLSPLLLSFLQKNLGSFSWWIVKMIKNSLEKEIYYGISFFNGIFYLLIFLDLIALLVRTIIDLPHYYREREAENTLEAKSNLLRRYEEENRLQNRHCQVALTDIEIKQELTRRGRIVLHNQTLEDRENRKVLVERLGVRNVPVDNKELAGAVLRELGVVYFRKKADRKEND